jgi:hypothetical protein
VKLPREHPEARRWREQAERHLRTVQDLMFELGKVSAANGGAISLDPPRDGARDGARDDLAVCRQCGRRIEGWARYRTRRLYCDFRCQQRAYRARHKLRESAAAR